jgi:hypothetical protein
MLLQEEGCVQYLQADEFSDVFHILAEDELSIL